MDFSFMMRLSSGLPVEIYGIYDGRYAFSWMADHLCKEEIFTFGEDELSIKDRNAIDKAVVAYCEKELNEIEEEYDSERDL